MKKLLLLGGGHAHLQVLKTLVDNPIADASVTLVSPGGRQIYSGMLPGWIAGHYAIEQCVVPLAPLCRAARVEFIESAAEAIDFSTRRVRCAGGAAIEFDVLSIDTGPIANISIVPGAAENAIAVRPLESFIEQWSRVAAEMPARTAAGRETSIVMVGGGAAGVELALSMQHALGRHRARFTLVSAENTLPGSVGPRLHRIMRARGFQLHLDQPAAAIEPGKVTLKSGEIIGADCIIVSTGASAAPWPKASGLATDDGGFVLVDDHLRSISHANVFAAGDCATMTNFKRPKSGVYAVRAGPPLAANLRRALGDEPLHAHKPQSRSLYLISTGDKYAIASWGNFAWEGAWVWRWKNSIDRAFVKKYLMDT